MIAAVVVVAALVVGGSVALIQGWAVPTFTRSPEAVYRANARRSKEMLGNMGYQREGRPVTERWRSSAARQLAQTVRRAGGRVQQVSLGRMLVTGPQGQVTVPEPDTKFLRDLRSSPAGQMIIEQTGLQL